MSVTDTAVFAAVFAALSAGHAVGDHWIQRHTDSQHKGLPGWEGRLACLRHIASYLGTAAACLGLVWLYLGLDLDLGAIIAAFAVSGFSHYVADRREPLRRIADALGKRDFYELKGSGMNGSYLLDQAWHGGFTFWAALIAAGGVERLGLTGIIAAAIAAYLAVRVWRFERRALRAVQVAPVSPAVEAREPVRTGQEA